MKKLIIFLIVPLNLVLSSCKSKQQLIDNTDYITSELIIQHDKLTPVALPTDSIQLKARFECDSNYNVVLKELNEIKTRNIQSVYDWRDGFLDLRIRTGGDTVYIPCTDFYSQINKFHKRTITLQKTVKVEKKLTTLQKLEIAAGKLFLLLLGIGLIYIIVKYLIKLKIN